MRSLAEIDNRETIAKQRIAKGELRSRHRPRPKATPSSKSPRRPIEVSKAELDSMQGDSRQEPRRGQPDASCASTSSSYEKSIAQVKQAINEREIAGLTAKAKTAQFEATAIELDLRQIKAPFKGQVVEVFKKRGDWVQAGEPILHLVGSTACESRASCCCPNGASPDEVDRQAGRRSPSIRPATRSTRVKGIVGFASPVIEGVGDHRQFRIWAEVDNEKVDRSGDQAGVVEDSARHDGQHDDRPDAAAAAEACRLQADRQDGHQGRTGRRARVEARKPATTERNVGAR